VAIKEISQGVYYLGVCHWSRDMFDALVPLPTGTSYNCYLVKGSEKTALIDTVDPATGSEFLDNLKELNVERIDYIICNHSEQDHSGMIPAVLKRYPGAKVVVNAKSRDLLNAFFKIDNDKFIEIKDHETISLGDKTLEFILIPWSHWPDNMAVYLKEDRILFPNDLLGSHTADSSLFVRDECIAYDNAKRYYAQIMMPFRSNVAANLKKLEGLDISIIAPSHGQLYDNPSFIFDAYYSWISDNVENEVVIPYITMHGSTEIIVDYFINKLIEKAIYVKPFNMDKVDTGALAMATVNAATIVLGSPAVLFGVHPKIAYGAYLVNFLKPKTRYLGLIGSYGWGAKMVESVTSLLSNMKSEFLEPVLIKGHPDAEAFKRLDALADTIFEKHKQLGLA